MDSDSSIDSTLSNCDSVRFGRVFGVTKAIFKNKLVRRGSVVIELQKVRKIPTEESD